MEVFRIVDTNLFYETVFLEEQFFSQYVQVFDNISLYCDSTCISYVLGIPVYCKYLTELLERPQCQVWSMLNKCYKYYWIGFHLFYDFFFTIKELKGLRNWLERSFQFHIDLFSTIFRFVLIHCSKFVYNLSTLDISYLQNVNFST